MACSTTRFSKDTAIALPVYKYCKVSKDVTANRSLKIGIRMVLFSGWLFNRCNNWIYVIVSILHKLLLKLRDHFCEELHFAKTVHSLAITLQES